MSDKDQTPYEDLWNLWKNWRLENKESLQWGFKRALLHWKMWKEDWTELHVRMLSLVEETQVLQRQKEIIYKDSEAELTKIRKENAELRDELEFYKLESKTHNELIHAVISADCNLRNARILNLDTETHYADFLSAIEALAKHKRD